MNYDTSTKMHKLCMLYIFGNSILAFFANFIITHVQYTYKKISKIFLSEVYLLEEYYVKHKNHSIKYYVIKMFVTQQNIKTRGVRFTLHSIILFL